MHWNVPPDALPGSATFVLFWTAGLTTESGSWQMESMNMMYSRGPSMEPWGTPEVTLVKFDAKLSKTTCCLSVRYFANHFRREPDIPLLQEGGHEGRSRKPSGCRKRLLLLACER